MENEIEKVIRAIKDALDEICRIDSKKQNLETAVGAYGERIEQLKTDLNDLLTRLDALKEVVK